MQLFANHVCDAVNFEINLIFPIQTVFSTQQSQNKNLNILRVKRAFNMKQKSLFIILKGLHWNR